MRKNSVVIIKEIFKSSDLGKRDLNLKKLMKDYLNQNKEDKNL